MVKIVLYDSFSGNRRRTHQEFLAGGGIFKSQSVFRKLKNFDAILDVVPVRSNTIVN